MVLHTEFGHIASLASLLCGLLSNAYTARQGTWHLARAHKALLLGPCDCVLDDLAPRHACPTIHHLMESSPSFTALLQCQPLQELFYFILFFQEIEELHGALSSSTAEHLFMYLAHISLSYISLESTCLSFQFGIHCA